MEALIGKNVIVRTVTSIYMGRLVSAAEHELVLEGAAWVAEQGIRWAEWLSTGDNTRGAEIEPYPDGPVVVNRGATTDVSEWKHKLVRAAIPK